MSNDDISAWNECFREPVQEIINQSTSASYLTKDGIELAKSADEREWEPSESILELIPKAKEIEVVLITKGTDLNVVNKDLSSQKHVGLVVLGPVIQRGTKPSLIVLTTNEKFYAIDPHDTRRGIEFLKRKLSDPNIQFWTTNGLHESDSLYDNYKINLNKYGNVSCCTGSHIHLMKSFNAKPLTALWIYPKLAIENQKLHRRNSTIRIERFEDLVEMWLDIDKNDIHFDLSQLPHLNTRPLSLTAINIIKKRCLLVIPLALSLEFYNWKEISIMSQNSFERLTECNKLVRQTLLRSMKKLKPYEFDIAYYAHLEGGV